MRYADRRNRYFHHVYTGTDRYVNRYASEIRAHFQYFPGICDRTGNRNRMRLPGRSCNLRADVPPIIATMGFMYIYRAMGYLVSHNGEWASAAALGKFKDFATTKFLGMSLVIWVIIFCYAVFFVFMKWTTLGRRIYAVGSNPSAAEVSGINVKNIKLLVYTIMGLLAGLGGALQVSIYASAMPDMQQGGEMDVIAACVIGGVSMSGGRGTVLGALLGSLILATIAKALPLIPFFDQLWLNTIKGVIILVVVVVNIVLQRTADKNALKGREM